jgi:carbon monoxide dehydrogenase subunit G
MALCFTANTADRVWEFVDDFEELAAIISFINRLFCYN